MKNIITLITLFFISLSAFAGSNVHPEAAAPVCTNISGKYFMAPKTFIVFSQNGCVALSQSWCKKNGTHCTLSPYGWLLDGVLRIEGLNSANWAEMTVDQKSLHRINWEDSHAIINDLHCFWKELTYTKVSNGDLEVTYNMDCVQTNGEVVPLITKKIWPLVK